MSDFDDEPTVPNCLTDDEPTQPNAVTKLIRAIDMLPRCHCGRFDLGCAEGNCVVQA